MLWRMAVAGRRHSAPAPNQHPVGHAAAPLLPFKAFARSKPRSGDICAFLADFVGVGRGCRSAGLALLALVAACDCSTGRAEFEDLPQIGYKRVAVVERRSDGFTQGLAFVGNQLFESTGHYGRSRIREVDRATGQVLRTRKLPDDVFGEGLTALPSGLLMQLTWKEGRAFVWDPETLREVQLLRYEGEGWGICSAAEGVWVSDGTDTVVLRDPKTFAVLRTQQIAHHGEPVRRLNALECLPDGRLLANVWMTTWMVRIDPQTGKLDGALDLAPFDREAENMHSAREVPNGLALEPETGHLWLTGKYWPMIFVLDLGLTAPRPGASDGHAPGATKGK